MRWKSYADSLREIMVDAGKFDEEPYTVRDKLMYERYMAEFSKDIKMEDDFTLKYIEKPEVELPKFQTKDDNFER